MKMARLGWHSKQSKCPPKGFPSYAGYSRTLYGSHRVFRNYLRISHTTVNRTYSTYSPGTFLVWKIPDSSASICPPTQRSHRNDTAPLRLALTIWPSEDVQLSTLRPKSGERGGKKCWMVFTNQWRNGSPMRVGGR